MRQPIPLAPMLLLLSIGAASVTACGDERPMAATSTPQAPGSSAQTTYALHTGITATVFWVGEPIGNGSSADNSQSAWDDDWLGHFGGFDDPQDRNGYQPAAFTPRENPFYFDLPYDDFTDS